MWSENGKLHHHKMLVWEEHSKVLKELLSLLVDNPVGVHFRTASVGQITLAACHPHSINPYIAFMHNGNLFHFSDDFYPKDGLTDSQRFCKFIQSKLVSPLNPDMWTYAIGQYQFDLIEQYAKLNYSKMLFMTAFGDIRIINEDAGMWQDGCWYSNGGIKNYVGYGYSGAYPYFEGDTRHPGGVLSVQGFANKDEWQKCEWCEGWFHELKGQLCNNCQGLRRLYE